MPDVLFTVDLEPSRQGQQAYSNAGKVLGMIGRVGQWRRFLLEIGGTSAKGASVERRGPEDRGAKDTEG